LLAQAQADNQQTAIRPRSRLIMSLQRSRGNNTMRRIRG
jgi:hypothetical protein